AVDEVLVQAHGDAKADRAVLVWRRDLGDYHVGFDRPGFTHQLGDFAEAHWHEPDLFLLEELANPRRGLPGDIAKVRPQSFAQKRVVAEGQPGVDSQIVKPFDLLLKGGVETRRFHAAVREDDRAAVGNGAYGFNGGHEFHSFLYWPMAYGSLATLALYCPVQSGSRILRDGPMAPTISHKL